MICKGPLFFPCFSHSHWWTISIDIDSIDMLNAFTCISLYYNMTYQSCVSMPCCFHPQHMVPVSRWSTWDIHPLPKFWTLFEEHAPSVQPWQLQARGKLGKVTDFAAYMAMTLNSVTLKDCGFDQQWEMAEMAADFTGCLKTRPETPMIHVALIFACWVWSNPYLSKR